MKIKNQNYFFVFLFISSVFATSVMAQGLCTDNVNTVYGLNTTGCIRPINLVTGVVGARLDSLTTPNIAENSNGIGFNPIDDRFYYFHRSGAAALPFAEFVAYDATAHTLTVLPGTPPTAKVRSGCVNNTGTGYYCLEPSGPFLYYYNIAAGTWTKITSVFKVGATDVSLNFKNLVSGDMAFDQGGSLWILLSGTSSGSKYALYKIMGPVPTTVQATLSVLQVIPLTATPGSVNFTGFGFNANGAAYLTTGSGAAAGNNVLYSMTRPSLPLNQIAGISKDDAGADMTSCVFTYVLPVKWLGFTAELKTAGVELKWDVAEDAAVTQYRVEHSTDGTLWKELTAIKRKASYDPSHTEYSYTDLQFSPGKNYYRIVQESISGEIHLSGTKYILTEAQLFSVSPNPAKNVLFIKQGSMMASRADIFDSFGRLVLTTLINSSNQSIDISQLAKGDYLIKLRRASTETGQYRFVKL